MAAYVMTGSEALLTSWWRTPTAKPGCATTDRTMTPDHISSDRSDRWGVLSDEQLLERARAARTAEREQLLEELYRRYYPKVAGWCLAICPDSSTAEDLAQEVFLKVHRSIDSFAGKSRFGTWLYVITRRTHIDRSKQRRRAEERRTEVDEGHEAFAEPPLALERLGRAEAAQWLRRALSEHLDELEARVLILHFVEGMTLPAITRLLKLENRSGAKKYIVGGLRKLRRHAPSHLRLAVTGDAEGRVGDSAGKRAGGGS